MNSSPKSVHGNWVLKHSQGQNYFISASNISLTSACSLLHHVKCYLYNTIRIYSPLCCYAPILNFQKVVAHYNKGVQLAIYTAVIVDLPLIISLLTGSKTGKWWFANFTKKTLVTWKSCHLMIGGLLELLVENICVVISSGLKKAQIRTHISWSWIFDNNSQTGWGLWWF